MTAFLLCKSEAEHSATGPEREREIREERVGGQGRRMWAFQRVITWMPPTHNSRPRKAASTRSGPWSLCSNIRGRKKSKEMRFS